ncbi:unnamed protein product [Rotaria socialis]|uniref:Uncharacterized protein n=1 Tax=Rotaria socialis TaxID=392032 RepID=A0A821CLK7_9BILA|nr:unnamed protein product [Rotaria socialis]
MTTPLDNTSNSFWNGLLDQIIITNRANIDSEILHDAYLVKIKLIQQLRMWLNPPVSSGTRLHLPSPSSISVQTSNRATISIIDPIFSNNK